MTTSRLARWAKPSGRTHPCAAAQAGGNHRYRLPCRAAKSLLFILAYAALSFQAEVHALSLTWDANPEPDISSYEVRYGTDSDNLAQVIDAGNVTSVPLSGLQAGEVYYFAVTAINTSGLRSLPSDLVSYEVPSIPPANQAPVATSSSVSTSMGTSVAVSLGASDPNGDSLVYSILSGPGHGTLSGSAPNLTYLPGAGFTGSDAITFRVNDGSVDSNTATVSITVEPDPQDSSLIPHAGWSLHHVDSQDSAAHPAANAIDGLPGTFWHTRWDSGATPPPHEIQIDLGGFYQIEGFRYLPRQDSSSVGNIGQYQFYVSVDGEHWGSPVTTGTFANTKVEKEVLFAHKAGRFIRLRALTEVNGNLHSAVAELGVLGQEVDGGVPSAVSQSVVTRGGAPVGISLSASDPDGDSLSYSIETVPRFGTLSGSPPSLIYTPVAGFFGVDSFTFTASDGVLASVPTTVSVTVTEVAIIPLNRAPEFDSMRFSRADGEESSPYQGQTIANAASDPDAGDSLTFEKLSGPGWLKVTAAGGLFGTPVRGTAGSHEFKVRVSDDQGATDEAVLVIEVASAGVPLPWTVKQLGGGKLDDAAGSRGGNLTLKGAGKLTGTKDGGTFVWQLLRGDGMITARVRDYENSEAGSQAGIMIRNSLAANSRYVFLGVDGRDTYRWLRRNRTNGKSAVSGKGTGRVPKTWLRMVRRGETITSYKSQNGKNWQRVASSNVPLNKSCYIGLMVGGPRKDPSEAVFRNVKVKP